MKQILLLLFFGFSIQTFGQTYPANPLDKTYTPPAGSIFDGTSSKNKSGPTGRVSLGDKKNLISLNLPLALRGIGTIGYERIITKWLSVHGYVGLTFASDYLRLIGAAYYQEFSENKKEGLVFNGVPTGGGMKPFFQFGLKLFIDEEPSEGDYFGLFYRYYQNNYKYDFSSSIGEYAYKAKFSTYNLVYGKTRESDSGKIIHDTYIGLGYRITTVPALVEDIDGNTIGVDESKTFSAGNLLLLASYTFSFSF